MSQSEARKRRREAQQQLAKQLPVNPSGSPVPAGQGMTIDADELLRQIGVATVEKNLAIKQAALLEQRCALYQEEVRGLKERLGEGEEGEALEGEAPK